MSWFQMKPVGQAELNPELQQFHTGYYYSDLISRKIMHAYRVPQSFKGIEQQQCFRNSKRSFNLNFSFVAATPTENWWCRWIP